MRVIAIATQKGGTGKSTLTHNLGDILAAEHDARVLLIDSDAQASLTQMCGKSPDAAGLAEVLRDGVPVRDVVQVVDERLHLLSADTSLTTVERQLYDMLRREDKLKNALAPLSEDYDYVLIDCAPARSLLVVNALSAADSVLIPTLPNVADIRALIVFLETVELMRREINPPLRIIGIVFNMFDTRLTHHASVAQEVESTGLLLPVRIGKSTRVAESGAYGEALRTYDKRNKQLDNFRALAELIA